MVKSIALDFDGTIAYTTESSYPYIESVNYKAIEVMKRFKKAGGKIVLFTCRTDEDLDIAVECLRGYGLEVDAVNEDLQETIDDWYKIQPDSSVSPKVFVDLYIDDRAFPACRDGINWDEIESYIMENRDENT